MKYYCNPMNLEYRYQFMRKTNDENSDGKYDVYREAADPSLIEFKGMYYLFPSMTAGFFISQDLHEWKMCDIKGEVPIYDYAPDVRVIGDYIYLSASKQEGTGICDFFRSMDPQNQPFERIEGSFTFWDPNLFQDDDGRVYFYWGCGNVDPIWGVELDPITMRPKMEPIAMFDSNPSERGYERAGEDHVPPKSEEKIKQDVADMKANVRMQYADIPEDVFNEQFKDQLDMLYKYLGNTPFIEGAWMTKHDGRYYLQYAIPGTEFNIYGDGVYISDKPLGPFKPAKNNPYSYNPGGFITGAGHGSTLKDLNGDFWHIASLRISHNRNFERRVGLWKAGFDQDGELYCDQRFADWPIAMESSAFSKPDWMLLSSKKGVKASSGKNALNAVDEDIRTFWRADSNDIKEWIEVDLEKEYDVHAVQINFMDDQLRLELPKGEKAVPEYFDERYIDQNKQKTRWLLEGSVDGKEYFTLEDKIKAETDYAHDLLVWEGGRKVRYIRLSNIELPYKAVPCVSGIRVFGKGMGDLPQAAKNVNVELIGDMDMRVSWEAGDVVGANILWGYAKDKLYHSCMVFDTNARNIGALVKGEPVYVRIDTFNEVGVMEGKPQKVK